MAVTIVLSATAIVHCNWQITHLASKSNFKTGTTVEIVLDFPPAVAGHQLIIKINIH